MSYASEGYISYERDNERVASMIRAITQAGIRDFKEQVLDTIYKKKLVNGIDIGEICSNLSIKVVGSLKDFEIKDDSPENEEIISDLLMILYEDYEMGINPNNDIVWISEIIEKGLPLLGKKINTLPGTGKVAPMASLVKPEKEEEGMDVKHVGW